jgi:transposase InsO family protein
LIDTDVKKTRAQPRCRAPIKRQPRLTSKDPGQRAPHRRRGWEFVHIAVDDYSRLAYAEVLADEKATTAVDFLRRAVAFYRRYGIEAEQLLTDNGACYRAVIHALACRRLGVQYLRTRPHRPQTNGKAERFIRSLLAAGPTALSTAHPPNDHEPLTAGSGTPTIDADTQPSATKPRSPEPTCSGPTSRARAPGAGSG